MGYYFLYRIGQFIVLVLPLRLGYWLGGSIGYIWSFVNYKARVRISANLKVIFGTTKSEKELKKDSRKIFVNFGKYLVEFLRLHKVNKQYIEQKIKFNNFEILEAHKKKGFIAVSAHLGNWELGGAVLSGMGVKMNVVALVHKYPKIDSFFCKQRGSHGERSIPVGRTVLKNIFKYLKNGEAVALLGDRDFSNNGIEMDFFGKSALIPKGPAYFSIKTGLPIIFCFFIRGKDNLFNCFIEGPLYPQTAEVNEESIKRINEEIIKILERYIRQYYAQWLMFYHLWEIDRNKREEII